MAVVVVPGVVVVVGVGVVVVSSSTTAAPAALAVPGAAAHHPLHAQGLISRLANLKMMCQPKFDLSEKNLRAIGGGGWRHWIVVILIL